MTERIPRGYILEAVLLLKATIDRQPLSKSSVSDLIEQAGIGRNKLRNHFKKITGKTISRYRLEVRMAKARELLLNNKHTIQQVAQQCGYRRQDHFCIDFKKIHRHSPSQVQSNQHTYNGNHHLHFNDAKN